MKKADVNFCSLTGLALTQVLNLSIYRHSQDFYKHQIKAEPDQANGPRYSLTFRSIHWSNFNSTMLIGDSNFGKIQFGTGKGKVEQATPRFRSFNPKTSDIDPLACTSYRNVVVMTGTNDLKKNNLSDTEILDLYKVYKTKISQIKNITQIVKYLFALYCQPSHVK